MRAFFSISVPTRVAERLLALVPPVRGVRRARPDTVHLTLHFLGDAPDDLLDRFELPPLPAVFSLTPGRVLLLPESGPVRVLAASVIAPHEPLRAMYASLAAELARLGVPLEPRPFLPHITLARSDPPLPQQVRSQTPMAPREDLSFPVTHLHFHESRTTPQGVQHVLKATWPLATP